MGMRVRPQNCDREGQAETQEGEIGSRLGKKNAGRRALREGKRSRASGGRCSPEMRVRVSRGKTARIWPQRVEWAEFRLRSYKRAGYECS